MKTLIIFLLVILSTVTMFGADFVFLTLKANGEVEPNRTLVMVMERPMSVPASIDSSGASISYANGWKMKVKVTMTIAPDTTIDFYTCKTPWFLHFGELPVHKLKAGIYWVAVIADHPEDSTMSETKLSPSQRIEIKEGQLNVLPVTLSWIVEKTTNVIPQGETVSEFKLSSYPNPFNPTTTIQFSLVKSERITLKAFNAVGQEVATIYDEHLEAGTHSKVFDGSGLASGTYFVRLETSTGAKYHRLMLVK